MSFPAMRQFMVPLLAALQNQSDWEYDTPAFQHYFMPSSSPACIPLHSRSSHKLVPSNQSQSTAEHISESFALHIIMALPPLPDPKRYITDNDENGVSFFSKTTAEAVPTAWDLAGAQMRLAYTAARAPLELSGATDLASYQKNLQDLPPLIPVGGGTNVWYIDTPPGAESPMHRTVTLNFVIQIAGEIELIMANGETRLVKPGDMTVQRSSAHMWRNPSQTQWSRMVGVMAECQPVVTKSGQTLGPDFPAH
nr:hypothetical protein CFP56_53675 [Quercus suber]